MKKWLLLGISTLVIVAAGVVFLARKKSDQPKFDADKIVRLSFHPDDVQAVGWKVGEAKLRNVRKDGLWKDDFVSRRMQTLLNSLSLIHKEELTQHHETPIEVTLEMKDKVKWVGVFWPGHFMWTEGLWKGYGAKLTDEENNFFISGRYAFHNTEVKLCRARIQEIARVEPKQLYEKIFSDGLKWVREPAFDPAPSADDMEKWMSENCTLNVDYFVDPLLVEVPKHEKLFKLTFVDKKAATLTQTTSYFILDDLHFVSRQLANAFSRIDL